MDSVLSNTDTDQLIKSITTIIIEIINENSEPSKAMLREEQKDSPFFSKKIPSISIQSYIERLMKYTKMEQSTLILMLMYLDRLCEKTSFLLTHNTIHRYVKILIIKNFKRRN